ncbi:nuclear transport factor 2 family protein [Striga asiatica]|uniref:Nuclear transport factor 2 family protein n=1 Tax=Striga asiatica TaxID=4170 RepID=A0A5A7PBY2_STRAF|nr:nuclear transport factor 2 family protein [Striga asiatica]
MVPCSSRIGRAFVPGEIRGVFCEAETKRREPVADGGPATSWRTFRTYTAEVRCYRTLYFLLLLLWPRNGILLILDVGGGDGGRGGGKNTRVGDGRRSEELVRQMPRSRCR